MFDSKIRFLNFCGKMTWFLPLLLHNGAQNEKVAKAGVAGLLIDCFGLSRLTMIK
jgi:hypothetical protein